MPHVVSAFSKGNFADLSPAARAAKEAQFTARAIEAARSKARKNRKLRRALKSAFAALTPKTNWLQRQD